MQQRQRPHIRDPQHRKDGRVAAARRLEQGTGEALKGEGAHHSREPAQADDRRDRVAGEHVAHRGEQVGGPPLVRAGGHGHKADGDPQAAGRWRERRRNDAQGGDEQRGLAAAIDAPAALDERAGDPPAGHRPDVCRHVDHDERRGQSPKPNAEGRIQELGEPEQIEQPDRVGHRLADDERPRLAARKQTAPGDGAGRLHRIAADPRQLGVRQSRVLTRLPVGREPHGEPGEVERSRGDERPTPPQRQRDPRDEQRGEHHADVAARVEDPGRQRPLALGEPLGHGFHARRKIARLANAEEGARHAEPRDRADQRVTHRRQAPETDGAGESTPHPDAVEEASHAEQANAVGDAEPRHDRGVVRLPPAELARQRRREDAEDLPVDVVDRGRREQQRHDGPPHPIRRHWRR